MQGGISNEIKSLQEQSLAMSVQMNNRKLLTTKIHAFLQKVAVPESLINAIVDAEINEAWLPQLRSLSEKLDFIQSRGGGSGSAAGEASATDLSDLTINPFETAAGRESVPQITKLKDKATSRLRDFLIRHIGEMCRTKTNMGKQQEYVLMKYEYAQVCVFVSCPRAFLTCNYLQAFLSSHSPEVAREVRSVYVESVGRTYEGIFKKYYTDMYAQLLPLPQKGDTIIEYSGGGAGSRTGGLRVSSASLFHCSS